MDDDTKKTHNAAPDDQNEETEALGADVSKIGAWFIATVELEQQRSESRSRAFKVGEGIEMVLDD